MKWLSFRAARGVARREGPLNSMTSAFLSALASVVVGGMAITATAAVQPLVAQEFTQQRMLVMNFDAEERNMGRQVANQLRGQVRRGTNRRELYVLETWEVDSALTRSGFGWDDNLPFPVVRVLARDRGTDELVVGSIERRDGQLHARARLVLTRDALLAQPLPDASGRGTGDIANALGAAIVAARGQLPHVRRCENAAREQQLDRAESLARTGIAEHPRGTIIRTCLVRVLARRGKPNEVIQEAHALLAIDPENAYAIEHAAEAYDQLERRGDAAGMWRRLVDLAPDSTLLVTRVVNAMLDGKNPAAAEPVIVHASELYPDDVSLLRLRWHAHFDAGNFEAARTVGERLLVSDDLTQNDSTFFVRMVGVYQRTGRPVGAVALAARAVERFPGDARPYVLYTELVRAEAPVVLTRALNAFPSSAELLALHARDLRREGRVGEALETTRLAVEADPRLAQGFLQLAQAYTDAGMPDSAFAMLPRAVSNGERPEQVAQYALSRGNAIYREHAASSHAEALELAMNYLALSDSLLPTREAKFLLGASGSILVRIALERANTERACRPVLGAARLLPITMQRLHEGAELAPEAASQQLEYLGRLDQVVSAQLERYCSTEERSALVEGP